MAFNNMGNKVTLKGYVSSEISQVSDYAIEFSISVPRKTHQGECTYSDSLTVYVNDYDTCQFCKTHFFKSLSIVVKGEIRRFYNGDIKICSDSIAILSRKK